MGVLGPPRSGASARLLRVCGALCASTLRPHGAHSAVRLVRLGGYSAGSVRWLVKRLGCLVWHGLAGLAGTAERVRLSGYG